MEEEYEALINMTDEQAADILENIHLGINGGRGNGKTFLLHAYQIALGKAIKKLRGEEHE